MPPQDLQNTNGLEHEHFILDAELEKPLVFDRRHEITRKLIDELMQTLKMEELGPLQVYDATDPAYPGWSFIQPITTSHISGHYFEESGRPSHIHLDIYSCKHFEWQNIISILHIWLRLNKWSATCALRAIEHGRKITQIEGNGNGITNLMQI